jgi:uncharacterized protein
MVEESIDFPSLIETALIGVVREVLRRAAEEGLPGEHHFYLSFDTMHPDLVISDRLRRAYPEEMTIVLENQFWDLEVDDSGFSVKLAFDGVRERLVVPFAALETFVDPSVPFGLRFGVVEVDDEEVEPAEEPAAEESEGGRLVEFRKRGE